MRGQLHVGQIRFHDFGKLREAREERQLAAAAAARRRQHQHQHQQHYHYQSKNVSSSSILNPLMAQPLSLSLSLSSCNAPLIRSNISSSSSSSSSSRGFWSGSIISDRLSDFRLKQLERIANHNPTNANAQYDFLSELGQRYPEAVIERFEHYTDCAVDERCALLYFSALQRGSTGSSSMASQFHLSRFVQRLREQSSHVHPLKIQALSDLTSKQKLSKAAQVTAAMQIITGASTTAEGAASGLSSAAVAAGGRGVDAKHPLHVQLQNPTSGKTAVIGLARQVLIAFVVVSALTAVLDEKGMGRAMGMSGGKHINEAEGSDVRFDDVKGVQEAKAELEEIVMYLKDPTQFTRLGGKLPRGLLLTGPPGTGKTLLAKAIAGEAGVPFFFSSGSQFEEVYVGLGAKRVRELFEAAQKKSPAIIFIDEIDAVGGMRKLKDQSALKMTLNELLVQLDGFEENNGVIVIGATNFAEALDPALLRPGRFDKHVSVPLPDVGGRKEILEMYATKTKLAKDVDLNILARGTTGFSGADLYNLMNQAALKASVEGLNSITMAVFEYAKDKILMGAERKTAVITAKTARCTAFHEAGHALVATLTEGAMPIHKATIMPRGTSLGMVTMLPDGDQTSQSYKEMLAGMDVAMGGRVAEELIFGPENITSGAVSDIANATKVARAMVTKYGFSPEIGIVFHSGDTGEQSASEGTRHKIDNEVKRLTDASYLRAKEMLKKYSKAHYLLAETLIEYETLTGDEVRDIIKHGKKPNRPVIQRTTDGTRGDTSVLQSKNNSSPDNNNNNGNNGRKSRIPGLGDKVGSRRDTSTQ